MYPTATDAHDGNWLKARVTVSAGAWAGSFEANLRAEEFEVFREQCESLQKTLKGTAAFNPLEPWFRLRLTGDGKGHIELTGDAIDRVGTGNQLRFAFRDLDQTFLPPLIDQLREVERNYPVVGR
jgi:hypothetical protein